MGAAKARPIAPLDLPVEPPVEPMLAAPGADRVPQGASLGYEPKWDGFRTIVFRHGERVVIQGRGGDDLAYAFPEVVEAVTRGLPDRIVLDGELIALSEGGQADFTVMATRIRPRSEAGGASIASLATQSPVTLVAFDLLAAGGDNLMSAPFSDRRARLEEVVPASSPIRVTPHTRDPDLAARWFHDFEGGGIDGLIVKDLAGLYTPGRRTLVKVKHQRTLDAVVAGWRPKAGAAGTVGSLLLGLYDADGRLHHIGVASGISAARGREFAELLEPLSLSDGDEHPWLGTDDSVRRPGEVNRWSRGRSSAWHPVEPVLVAEVAYDQFSGDRLRHVASWARWRPDRDATSCTYDQVPRPDPVDIATILNRHPPA